MAALVSLVTKDTEELFLKTNTESTESHSHIIL